MEAGDLLDIHWSLRLPDAMATGTAAGSKHPIDLEMRWNFGDSRSTSLSLDEFLAQKEADGVEFFAGKSRGWWVSENGAGKRSSGSALRRRWTTSPKGCKARDRVLPEVLEDVEETIRGKASLARLEAALNVQYAQQYENKVYQYDWALRHPVVKDAVTKALANRFHAR